MRAGATLLIVTLTAASVTTQQSGNDTGLTGRVLGPDGKPATRGTVVLQAGVRRISTPLSPSGEYRLVPDAPGAYRLIVTGPEFAPYQIDIDVPASRTATLPPLHLAPATFFRVRVVSHDGAPIMSAQLRHMPADSAGEPLLVPELRSRRAIDSDGTLTVGPLVLAKTLMAVVAPPFADLRLPDIEVGPHGGILDGGTVVMQPGAALHVDVLTQSGDPLANQDVSIEDAAWPSPLFGRVSRTTTGGRVTFDRLSAGRYRLRTPLEKRCNGQSLSVSRLVNLPGAGEFGVRLVVGGHLTLQVSSPSGVVGGVFVSASPEMGMPNANSGAPLAMMRPTPQSARQASCSGRTDSDGRLTLENFPAGPARVELRLPNSTYLRRIAVPERDQVISLAVPDGIAPVHVFDATSKRPVANAVIAWSGDGARVEALSTATGDALLESTGTGPGVIEVSAQGFQPATAKLHSPPSEPYAIALTPERPSSLDVRVVAATGEPLGGAAVALIPRRAQAIGRIASADGDGIARFDATPPGPFDVVATASGFAVAHAAVTPAQRRSIVLSLQPQR